MCENQKPDIKEFISNLKAQMPFGRKITSLLRNNAIKIIKLQSCCGHPDEPGC